MAQRFIADTNGFFSCELEVHGLVLDEALDRQNADEVLACAVIVALSVLAEGEPWVDGLMDSLAKFMTDMRDGVRQPLQS